MLGMSKVIAALAETLRDLTGRLGQLSAEDEGTLARIGADLEAAVSGLPDEMRAQGDLLELGLQALQAVYLKSVPFPQGVVAGVAAAVAAAERSLHTCGHEDPSAILSQADQALRALLDGDFDEASTVPDVDYPSAELAPGVPELSIEAAVLSPEEEGESDIDGIVNEFLVESYENLDQLDRDLLTLEQNPSDRETLSSIFRTIHTIKGTCGFLGFTRLEALTHVGENLLSRLRDGELALNPEITSALLLMVDAVREILSTIEAHRRECEADHGSLIEMLTALQQQVQPPARLDPEPDPFGEPEPPPPRFGEILVSAGRIDPADLEEAVAIQKQGDPRHVGEILVEKGVIQPRDVADALRLQEEARSPGIAESSIRVDVALLDDLMDLVGELVLARNQALQFTATAEGAPFISTAQRLNLITTELQAGVMKTRMQPIGNVWSKFPRVVRDLSKSCGKQIRLEMEGQETELDRTIIEAIKHPLTHIIRNSVDHGMETPEVRVKNGKPPEGRLSLRAYHEGGQVNIEISDDGAGIDPERIRQKALRTGLITPEQAARMSDRELTNLIFLPGFSTAQKVTNVSGRGVGMDVVRTNIEKVGGTVDIQSQLGQGTTLKIKIPLTLAIIPALIVTSGGNRYAVPQASMMELVRLDGQEAHQQVEMIHGTPVYRLRGKLLPLVSLSRELMTDGNDAAGPEPDTAAEAVHIVVLQTCGRPFGLVVDGIHDTEEIVVKPLGSQLKGLAVFAGATIMGDGKVALILDVLGLAQRARVVSEFADRSGADLAVPHPARAAETQTMLLVALGAGTQSSRPVLAPFGRETGTRAADEGRFALPLSSVARLEEFPAAWVETARGREAVQYRGQILPLIRLGRVLGTTFCPEEDSAETLQVVIYSDHGHSVGLVVDRILDIVEESVTISPTDGEGFLQGSVVIQGRITDLLDIPAIVRAVDPSRAEDAVAFR